MLTAQSANNYEFDPITHLGKVNGEIWPSVTQLLRIFKIVNYDGVSPDVLEAKRILGTRVHAACILLDDGNLDEDDLRKRFPECVPYVEAYRKFRIIEKFEKENKPVRLFSKKWKTHGEPDEWGMHLKNPYVLDIKCTYHLYKSCGAQTALYDMLINENYGIKIKERFGLLLKPSGNFELTKFTDKSDYTDVQASLHLYWANRNKYKTIEGV